MKTLALQSPSLRPLPRQRLAVAALILGAALAAAFIVYGHRVVSHRPDCLLGHLLPAGFCLEHARPAWAEPTALGIALVGIAGAAGVLVVRRRNDR